MASAAPSLWTAEQFGRRPDPGNPEELVRGRIVRMPPPNRRHGQVCSRTDRIIGGYVDDHDLGHVLSNDSGVITERDPDTVRGADVAFYSFARLPKGPLPQSYGPEVPELVVEVRSPGERWADLLAKDTEYLNAGVVVVLVLDPDATSAQVYRADQPPRILGPDDELTLPDLLGEFRVAVRRFFD
jgi:Uma2 family endonuclease